MTKASESYYSTLETEALIKEAKQNKTLRQRTYNIDPETYMFFLISFSVTIIIALIATICILLFPFKAIYITFSIIIIIPTLFSILLGIGCIAGIVENKRKYEQCKTELSLREQTTK